MALPLRRLRPDFLQAMDLAHAWPQIKAFLGWVREVRDLSIRNDVYPAMKEGLPVDQGHVRSWVEFVLDDSHAAADHARRVLADYVNAQGAPTDKKSAATIADCILEPLQDAFIGGVHELMAAFSGRRLIEYSVERCLGDWGDEAIRWLYVVAARESAANRTFHSTDEAVEFARSLVGVSHPSSRRYPALGGAMTSGPWSWHADAGRQRA